MSTYTIILPTYNDWKSLSVLLGQIERHLKSTNEKYKILIINDNSSEKNYFKLNKNNFFKEIKILNLKKNIGSQKAIATGLKYISKYKKKNDDKFIIMDSDGEDDPKKIKDIVQLLKKNKRIEIITMKRTIRKESFFFSILYELHLMITFMITFKYIRFGNFSFIDKRVIDKISNKKDLWLAYSATLNKHFNFKYSIAAPRRKRISGKSKMSYLGLMSHSLKIQSVYKKNIYVSYIIYSLILIFLYNFNFFGLITFFLIFILIIHSLIINFGINRDINGITFNLCLNNIKSIQKN